MAEGLTVGANDGDIISVAFNENDVELKVLALTCSTLVSCISICLSFLFEAIAAAEPAEAKIAREVAKSDGRFIMVLLYG